MTGVEISLLLIGCVFMIGSFFMTEKLSANELNKIAELSEDELKKIINREMEHAGSKIDDVIESKMDETSEIVERSMEKESNEQIMQIHDYSETVMESMKKTHDEIMFLYSMLNDKHTEMTSLAGDLQRLTADVRNMKETIPQAPVKKIEPNIEKKSAEPVLKVETLNSEGLSQETPQLETEELDEGKPQAATDILDEVVEQENHNEMILQLYAQGMSKVDIARKLGLGLGEVKLVIGLYKGDENL